MTPLNPDASDLLHPLCRPTAERINRVFDGELEPGGLDDDPHPLVCVACRGRIAAARALLAALAEPLAPAAVPSGLADRILSALRDDHSSRLRRRGYVRLAAACAALAASVVLVVGLLRKPAEPIVRTDTPTETATARPGTPEVAPEPRPAPVPLPRPLRIGDEFAKAGLALRHAPKAITEPASSAPDVLSKLTDVLARPLAPADDMEPARAALADLPAAARAGLEPVTGTAQKAFARLLRDVGTIGTKPKS